VNFLVDRCAGRRLAEWLQGQGHDVLESRSLGPDPGDRRLLELSTEQNRILVTIDTDFGRLIFSEGEPHPGIVRLPDERAERRIELMDEVLTRHRDDLEGGAVVTVKGNRIRVSKRLPPTG
jgi:predicted nuclease of predicted toxin-antitoxin system